MKQSSATLLFKTVLSYERIGDHVDEIKFDCPVCVTHVEVGGEKPGAEQQPLLKVFALDLNALAGARFASLCSTTISVPSGTSQTYRATEMVMTDHVVLRGRYCRIELSLWGACEHNVQMVRERMEAELGFNYKQLPDVSPQLETPLLAGPPSAGPYNWHPPNSGLPLPTTTTLAPPLLQALQAGLAYWQVVGERAQLIAENPPGQSRLKELASAAGLVADVMQGEGSKSQLASLGGGKVPEDAMLSQATEMALGWSQLLARRTALSPEELTVGLAGLAALTLLGSCRKAALQLLGKGVASTLMGVVTAQLAGTSVVRLAVCALDMITHTTGAAGCQALLNWWTPSSGARQGQAAGRARGAANGTDANGSLDEEAGSQELEQEDKMDADTPQQEDSGCGERGGAAEGPGPMDEDRGQHGDGPQVKSENGSVAPGPAKGGGKGQGTENGHARQRKGGSRPEVKSEPSESRDTDRQKGAAVLMTVLSRLVGVCMGRQPHGVVVLCVLRILRRLQACQAAARFQHQCELLVKGHRPHVELSLAETAQALRDCTALLHKLTHLCSAEVAPEQANKTEALDALSGRWSLAPYQCDPVVLEALLAHRVWPLCGALMHVPSLHMQRLKEAPQDSSADGGGGGRNTKQVQALQLQQLQQQLLVAMKGLLSALMSSRAGVLGLRKETLSLRALVQALDPSLPALDSLPEPTEPRSGSGGASGRRYLPSEMAQWLCCTTTALQAINLLERAAPGSRDCQRAVHALIKLSSRPGGVEVAAQLIALSGGALPALLQLLQLRSKVITATSDSGEESKGDLTDALTLDMDAVDVVEEDSSFAWEAMYAPHLLLDLVSAPQGDVLAAWLPSAADLGDVVRRELEAAGKAGGGGGGKEEQRVRRTLKEVQGFLQAATLLQDKGVNGLLEQLDSVLPRFSPASSGATGGAGAASGAASGAGAKGLLADTKGTFLLLRTGEKLACLVGTLHLLAALLRRSPLSRSWLAYQIYSSNGLSLMGRALRCALVALTGSKADSSWAVLGGDSMDDLERGRARLHSARLMRAVAHCLAELVLRLGGVKVTSGSLLQAILASHSAVATSCENLAVTVAHIPNSTPLLQARQALIITMLSWMEHEWRPDLISNILGVPHQYRAAQPAPAADASDAAGEENAEDLAPREELLPQGPEEMVAAMLALGDLFPNEWPPSGTARRSATLLPPSHMRQRAAFAKALEPCSKMFRDIIAFGAASENRMVRATLVRLCSKAAGLGGGMGIFLAQPLLEELMGIVKNSAVAAATAGSSQPQAAPAGSSSLAEGRRVLEVIVPLAFKPAIKAALLDLKAVSSLAKYLHRLVLSQDQEGSEGAACITMVLETLTLLCNPDIALNPLSPRQQRLLDDCPSATEASALLAVLLACLPHLTGGTNITMAKNIILSPNMGLATYPSGRLAIRQGAAKWHSTSLQVPHSSQRSDPAAYQAALSWASRKLWEAGERLGGEADTQVVANACLEVSQQLENLAGGEEDEGMEDQPTPAPAQNRFAVAVQAAKAAAGAAVEEERLSHIREVVGSTPAALLCDAPTQAFWRYARARASKSNINRKLTKWDAQQQDIPPATGLFGEQLTRRKRSREVAKPSGPGGEASKKVKSDDAEPRNPNGIPMVLAPPRRRDLMKSRANSTSRPPSMHVDDYEKQAQGHGSGKGKGGKEGKKGNRQQPPHATNPNHPGPRPPMPTGAPPPGAVGGPGPMGGLGMGPMGGSSMGPMGGSSMGMGPMGSMGMGGPLPGPPLPGPPGPHMRPPFPGPLGGPPPGPGPMMHSGMGVGPMGPAPPMGLPSNSPFSGGPPSMPPMPPGHPPPSSHFGPQGSGPMGHGPMGAMGRGGGPHSPNSSPSRLTSPAGTVDAPPSRRASQKPPKGHVPSSSRGGQGAGRGGQGAGRNHSDGPPLGAPSDGPSRPNPLDMQAILHTAGSDAPSGPPPSGKGAASNGDTEYDSLYDNLYEPAATPSGPPSRTASGSATPTPALAGARSSAFSPTPNPGVLNPSGEGGHGQKPAGVQQDASAFSPTQGVAGRSGSLPADTAAGGPGGGGSMGAKNPPPPASSALSGQLQEILRDPTKLRKLLSSQPQLAKMLMAKLPQGMQPPQ